MVCSIFVGTVHHSQRMNEQLEGCWITINDFIEVMLAIAALQDCMIGFLCLKFDKVAALACKLDGCSKNDSSKHFSIFFYIPVLTK